MSVGILGGLVMKLVANDTTGAGRLLESAGKSAIVGAAGPLGGVAGSLLDLLTRSAAGETFSRGAVKEKVVSAAKKKRQRLSHEQWMKENGWRFDWRSQPRRPAGTDAGGEWMEGRLDYPVAVKYTLSRRERQRRTRAIKAYKARQIAGGKPKTRTIRTAWGDY